LCYYTWFYIFFFGLIAHKEARFLLPVWPFVMLAVGELWTSCMKRYTRLFAFWLKVYVITEIITLAVMETQFRGHYKVRAELARIEPPIHSVFLSEPLWTPQYNLMHR
jgi:hypothetical protein